MLMAQVSDCKNIVLHRTPTMSFPVEELDKMALVSVMTTPNDLMCLKNTVTHDPAVLTSVNPNSPSRSLSPKPLASSGVSGLDKAK